MSGPTTTGRITAVVLGLFAGSATTYYFVKDYELIKRLDDPSKDEKRAFKVSFEASKPLRLKPEAEERIRREREERTRREQVQAQALAQAEAAAQAATQTPAEAPAK